MGERVFDGLKVIDCASFIAGPAAATVMSDFGAEVIKIEMPGMGDPYRRRAIPVPERPLNPGFILDARNKGMAAGAKAAGCKILEQQVNQQDNASGALPIVQAWKTKYGSKMTVILAYNDPSALGAIAAKGGDFQPIVTGMNGDADGIAALKNGTMFATGAVPNVELGESMAQVSWLILNKKPYPTTVNFPFQILTKANVGSYTPWSTRLKGPAMKITFVKVGGLTQAKATPDYSK